jgi:hypothetical protein
LQPREIHELPHTSLKLKKTLAQKGFFDRHCHCGSITFEFGTFNKISNESYFTAAPDVSKEALLVSASDQNGLIFTDLPRRMIQTCTPNVVFSQLARLVGRGLDPIVETTHI